MMHTISVVSGNGGGGKSLVACNLAYGLCTLGKRVLLIEAGLGKRADDIVLGITPSTLYTFKDVLEGIDLASVITHPDEASLPDFLPASHVFCPHIPTGVFDKIKAYAKGKYDYVIIDTSPWTEAFHIADIAIAICGTSYISLRNTGLCVSRAMDSGVDRVYTLINHLKDEKHQDVCIEDIIDETGAPLIGIIPYDEYAACSMERGDLIFKYNTASGRALENICKRIMGESVPEYEKGDRQGIFSRNKLVLK